MKKTIALLALAFTLIFLAHDSNAEPYISLYAGRDKPNDADITNKATHETGKMIVNGDNYFGGKAGYWFTRQGSPSFGLQLEGNGYRAEIKEIKPRTGPVAPVTSIEDFRSVAANLMVRLAEENIRPYAGLGVGWYYLKIGPGAKPTPAMGIPGGWKGGSDTSVGGQGLVGIDFLIGKNLSFFLEYKFTLVRKFTIEINDAPMLPLELKYQASQFYGGLSYNF